MNYDFIKHGNEVLKSKKLLQLQQITGSSENNGTLSRPRSDLVKKAYHGKFQSSVEHAKIGRAWPYFIAICPMVLCIISPHFRRIADILKALEHTVHSGWTDRQIYGQMDRQTGRQTDGWTAGCNDRQQYPSAPMLAEGKNSNPIQNTLVCGLLWHTHFMTNSTAIDFSSCNRSLGRGRKLITAMDWPMMEKWQLAGSIFGIMERSVCTSIYDMLVISYTPSSIIYP